MSASHGYLDNRRLNSGTFADIIGMQDKQFSNKVTHKLDHSSQLPRKRQPDNISMPFPNNAPPNINQLADFLVAILTMANCEEPLQ